MFLRPKSVLSGHQVLHKSFMSSYNVRLLHGRHSIGHNNKINALLRRFVVNRIGYYSYRAK